MRAYDSATMAALQNADIEGIVERDFIWIWGRSLDGLTRHEFAFWNDATDETVGVRSGETGSIVNRDYIGGGTFEGLPSIPFIADMTVRSIDIALSGTHPSVISMYKGYDLRHAEVECHRGLYNPNTMKLVAPPYAHFVGKINKAPRKRNTRSNGSEIILSLVSITRELTRTNPKKKSDEDQKSRNGDRIYRYTGVVEEWNVPWGEKARRE